MNALDLMYKIEINERLSKNFAKIPKRDYVRIVARLEDLKKDPQPRWVEKMQTRPGYRISVGNYRSIFEVVEKKKLIIILAISDRKDVYRKR